MAPSTQETTTSAGWSGYLKALGPGLLWAGAAIGVSHLVQSTQAGAGYGFSLVWIILLCLALKYPLFEYGHRYAAATGENLVKGYARLGKTDLVLFFVVCFVSGFIAIAGVTIVTGALFANLFSAVGWDVHIWSAIILAVCWAILVGGRFAWLDGTVKFIILILTLATLAAVAAAVANGPRGDFSTPAPSLLTPAFLIFLTGLLGWMPAPIEFSAISSLWIDQREKQTQHRVTMREALFDFRVGYIATAVLSVMFVALGAIIMFGTGESFETGAIPFCKQLIGLYTASIGEWATIFINLAAFAAMFSTTITVLDGYPRVLDATLEQITPAYRKALSPKLALTLWLSAGAIIGAVIIAFFTNYFLTLIAIATTAGFLAGPIFGFINLRLVTSRHMPAEHKPGWGLIAVSWLGIVMMTAIGTMYVLYLCGVISVA